MRNVVSLQGLLLCPFVFQPFYTQVITSVSQDFAVRGGSESSGCHYCLLVYEQRCLACSTHRKRKKNRKHGTQPGLHRSAKSCSLTHFGEFHMKFSGGTFKNSTKLYPFKYVWISRASYIFIWVCLKIGYIPNEIAI